MAFFFASDTHFGHANIIRHCNRPFASVAEMDAAIIDRINATVGHDDWLYHLGDFSFRGGDPAAYRRRIHCRRIVLIQGNHDPAFGEAGVRPEFAALFTVVHPLLMVKVQINRTAQPIMLCHYAMRVWERSHRGAWHLFGHSHGNLKDDPDSLSWDVGVDNNDFTPLGVPDLVKIMARKRFVPVDHHGRQDAADAEP